MKKKYHIWKVDIAENVAASLNDELTSQHVWQWNKDKDTIDHQRGENGYKGK